MAKRSPDNRSDSKPHVFLKEGEFNLPELEEKVLAFWDEQHIFERSIKEKKGEKFVFYEGPPYANGKPAIHHVISRVVKDVMLRYKTMRGFEVPRRAGWDTHGLPVEIATEKALGLKSKRDIEAFGVKLFNEKAREQVWNYKDEWERMTRRIGYWLDLKNAYVTYEPDYIESLWWTLSQISKRKLLFKGYKVVPWCTRDGTSLSSHELAQGYKEVSDSSVYVKFHLKAGQKFGKYATKDKAYILSWTTTPWTLPGNVALAVGEKITYTALRTEGSKELYILASDLVATVFKDQKVEIVHGDIKGKDLVGLEYEPLFKIPVLQSATAYKIYPASFVTTTDGAGVVHTAVMYGEDDFALGKKFDLPQHHTVNEDGKFTDDVPALAGAYVKSHETEERIFKYLEKNGNMLRTEAYVHEYPHCWRCGTAILYYARTSWFIGMSRLRAELLKENKTVNWTPDHVKNGRFGEWLKEAKDWNLSRDRYWGAPLPIWECRECKHTEVVGSLDALNKLAGRTKNNYWMMRHGEAENNVQRVLDSGQKDFHLTAQGKKQVEASIKKLKKQLEAKRKKIDLVISSDVMRTKETEAIDARILTGEKTLVDKRLQEIHLGPELSGHGVHRYYELYPTYESQFTSRPDGGESLRDLRARLWDFLQDCESKYAGKNILLVTHESPAWMLTAIAEGWTEKRTGEEKDKKKGYFIDLAEIRPLVVKNIPRNDTGEIDLHRPFADAIFPPCPQCKAPMKRVPEVADVWYDSGAMPYAQAHYPFASGAAGKSAGKAPAKLDYPADFISEGMDQTRGWFYTLFAIAIALGYKAPYKNVIALGLINDKFGQKMSKSKGNVVEPFAVIDKYGVDALRWYFYTGSPLGEPKNFDEAEIAKAFRRMHLIVYNSLVFWRTYADRGAKLPATPKNVLDQWVLARLDETLASVTSKLDAYEIREAALEIETFVDDLSRWHIRRSRRRLQRPESASDYAAASATLAYVLTSLIKMLAPFTPFFAEILYGAMNGTQASVHLDAWPTSGNKKSGGTTLIPSMKSARELAALGLAKRAELGIKVRQPLATMKIGVKLGKDFEQIIAEEVNVKKIIYDEKIKEGVELDTVITVELRNEGLYRDVARMIQELRQKAGLSPKDKITALLSLPAAARVAVEQNEAAFKSDVGAKDVEYKRSEKFGAEEVTKIEGEEAWVGIRKI